MLFWSFSNLVCSALTTLDDAGLPVIGAIKMALFCLWKSPQMSFGFVKLNGLGGSKTSSCDTVCGKTDCAERMRMVGMIYVFM
jgi:hypothetical protein